MSKTEIRGAIWNVVLTDDEIKALSEGVPPTLIRPEALLEYWPVHDPMCGPDVPQLPEVF